MFCAQCGKNIPDDSNVCAYCGVSTREPQAQQVYTQPTQPYYGIPFAPLLPGKGLGTASLVLGILSLVFCVNFFVSIPMSIVGLVLGCNSRSRAKTVGMKNATATAGIVCCIVALALTALIWVYMIVFTSAFTVYVDSYGNGVNLHIL